MSASGPGTGSEQRRSERVACDEQVTVELQATTLHGEGENISNQGVYLRAGVEIPVLVRFGGSPEPRQGSLVRVESIGDGSVGIAVRFAEPIERSSA